MGRKVGCSLTPTIKCTMALLLETRDPGSFLEIDDTDFYWRSELSD
jgi:hypothetical protein